MRSSEPMIGSEIERFLSRTFNFLVRQWNQQWRNRTLPTNFQKAWSPFLEEKHIDLTNTKTNICFEIHNELLIPLRVDVAGYWPQP